MIAEKLEIHEQNYDNSNKRLEKIVQSYAAVLETSAPYPGTVADVNKLPFPKQEIKTALIGALYLTEDPKAREHLKVAYISLSDWQEGVGEQDQGLKLSLIDQNKSIKSLAQAVAEQTSDANKWIKMSHKESETSMQALDKFNF